MQPGRRSEIFGDPRVPSGRVEKSSFSEAAASFLTQREASIGTGANPLERQKLDLKERNTSVAQDENNDDPKVIGDLEYQVAESKSPLFPRTGRTF